MKTSSAVTISSNEEKARELIVKLGTVKAERGSEVYTLFLDYLKRLPASISTQTKENLVLAFGKCFDMTRVEIIRELVGERPLEKSAAGHVLKTTDERELDKIIPPEGYLRDYVEYTRKTESPMIYHVLCALAVGGAALGRRVNFDMGFFKLYPPLAIMLVGPPGKVRKTSAIEIGLDFIRTNDLCPVMADKTSPESLASHLTQSATQVIPAPELSVFFGKQKYNEGLMAIILRLLDSPDVVTISTVARGDEVIRDVGVTIMGATTPSLLIGAAPTETSSSGFLSRFLVSYVQDTERFFPIPERGSPGLYKRLVDRLLRAQNYLGSLYFETDTREYFYEWYKDHHSKLKEINNDNAGEILARYQAHILRIAVILSILDDDSLAIKVKTLHIAVKILEFLQLELSGLLGNFRSSKDKAEVSIVINTLRKQGGSGDHAEILRRSGLNHQQFKLAIQTLIEGRRIVEVEQGFGKIYTMIGGTDDNF